MGLLEQMEAVDRLVRRPDPAGIEALAPPDRAVVATLDARRLEAVARIHARQVLGRWWAPRFPGTLRALGGDAARAALAELLVGSERFESAHEEDLLGTVFGHGLLDALEAGRFPDAAPWTRELLAYEYLLAVGFPRRGRGETCDAALEARLLTLGDDELADEPGPPVSFLSGGRLRHLVAVAVFEWPVTELHEGLPPEEVEDPPEAVVFVVEPEGVVEVEAPEYATDALELLSQGASDQVLAQALDQEWRPLRSWLRDLGLVSG